MQIGMFPGKSGTCLGSLYVGRGPAVCQNTLLAQAGLWSGLARRVVGEMGLERRVVRGTPNQHLSLAWILTVDRDPDLCCSNEVCDLRRAWAGAGPPRTAAGPIPQACSAQLAPQSSLQTQLVPPNVKGPVSTVKEEERELWGQGTRSESWLCLLVVRPWTFLHPWTYFLIEKMR